VIVLPFSFVLPFWLVLPTLVLLYLPSLVSTLPSFWVEIQLWWWRRTLVVFVLSAFSWWGHALHPLLRTKLPLSRGLSLLAATSTVALSSLGVVPVSSLSPSLLGSTRGVILCPGGSMYFRT